MSLEFYMTPVRLIASPSAIFAINFRTYRRRSVLRDNRQLGISDHPQHASRRLPFHPRAQTSRSNCSRRIANVVAAAAPLSCRQRLTVKRPPPAGWGRLRASRPLNRSRCLNVCEGIRCRALGGPPACALITSFSAGRAQPLVRATPRRREPLRVEPHQSLLHPPSFAPARQHRSAEVLTACHSDQSASPPHRHRQSAIPPKSRIRASPNCYSVACASFTSSAASARPRRAGDPARGGDAAGTVPPDGGADQPAARGRGHARPAGRAGDGEDAARAGRRAAGQRRTWSWCRCCAPGSACSTRCSS